MRHIAAMTATTAMRIRNDQPANRWWRENKWRYYRHDDNR
jgi:hypothetical protein